MGRQDATTSDCGAPRPFDRCGVATRVRPRSPAKREHSTALHDEALMKRRRSLSPHREASQRARCDERALHSAAAEFGLLAEQ